MSVNWSYYDKFEKLNEEYLPPIGEGETKAKQIVTSVNKLIYKWYNDGDVYDNSYYLDGWCNDLSDYANWLYKYTDTEVQAILDKIKDTYTNSDYEDLLKQLADKLLNADYLAEQNKFEKVDTIYACEGKFKYVENYDDEEEYY